MAAPVTQRGPGPNQGGLAGRRAVGGAGRLQSTSPVVHEHVVFDSAAQCGFAQVLELKKDVVLYSKLPKMLTMPTPLGNYHSEGALLVQKPTVKRLYSAVELKSNLFTGGLRDREWGKIECVREHSTALATGANPAGYLVAWTLMMCCSRSFDRLPWLDCGAICAA